MSAEPATVTWLTGLAPDIEWGPSAFSSPPVVVLDPGGSTLLVASEDDAGAASGDVETRTFPGFAVEDVDRASLAAGLVLEAVAGAREIACDLAGLPGHVVAALLHDGVELVDVGLELRAARAVKDGDEIEAIRAAVRIADVGHAAARGALAAGRTELELWMQTRAAMEAAAGQRLPVLADFVTGERTADVGGPPTARSLRQGDLLLVDLVPRLGGYWADSCATVALGEPPPAASEAHTAALAALERALELVRPGAKAGEIDTLARRTSPGYPHHTGHGIGTTSHEEPRIIPGSDRVLEPGMVIALEPGAYGDGWGVRVEQVAVVTEDGCDVLSGHDLSLT